MFLVAIMIGVGGYFFARKIRQVAGNPASIATMMAKMNPDVEVLSTDEGSGTITIKDKKTGKVVTMNFDDIRRGKLTVQEDGKEAVTIQASGTDGKASVDIKSAEGTAHIGAGAGRTPAWVPAYPGSSPQGTFSSSTDKEETGSFAFKANDTVEQVSKYYQDALKNAGFTVEQMGSGDGAVVSGKTSDEKRSLVVTLGKDAGGTSVSVVFNEKR
jgi:hypothetical protein